MFQSSPVIPLWETWRWPAASRQSSTWSSTTILSCWVSDLLKLSCWDVDQGTLENTFVIFPHWHPRLSFFVLNRSLVEGAVMPGASWMTYPWERELKLTKGIILNKYRQCLVQVQRICCRCIWFTCLLWMKGWSCFLWDRNRNRIWLYTVGRWTEICGMAGLVVYWAGLGTERRVKLTHAGFYGCGTICHPISIYRPPKQKLGKSSCMFDVYI